MLCKKNDVTVFAIFPSEDAYYYEYTPSDYDVFREMLRTAANNTGGELYVQSSEETVSWDLTDMSFVFEGKIR